jgi:6-phospho-beta-glucosidase
VGAPLPEVAMKLAIIGGGGIRAPLLINGLLSRGLPFDDIALFDIDAFRLQTMAELARARAPRTNLSTHTALAPCLDGAAFVVMSIRVGGLAAREHDEATSLAHGVVAQETIGPAGFAMAVRTIPIATHYARAIEKHARASWIVNFTNPVGVITQAMRRAADVNIFGICDTPTELFAETAHALRLDPACCTFDYIGLNHLGWLREVHCRGTPMLRDIWQDDETLSRVYSRPLFTTSYLSRLRLLPTEYVYFYEFAERAVANIRASGRTRGAEVAALTARLFAELADGRRDKSDIYDEYLSERSASYMQAESGAQAPMPPSAWSELTGYDRIAYDVMAAIVNDTDAIVPLNVANNGNIPELEPDDVIEVPCRVGKNGPQPLQVGTLPVAIRDLVLAVKAYERATIGAVHAGTRDALIGALALNPLVASREVSSTLVDRLTLA